MKSVLRRIKHLLISGLVVFSILSAPFNKNETVKAQTARQLPTRIQASDTPADITVKASPNRVVDTGDFNGDGVDDFIAEYYENTIIGGIEFTRFDKYGIIFGKRNLNNPVKINLSKNDPNLSLPTERGGFGRATIARLDDLNADGIDEIVWTQSRSTDAGSFLNLVVNIFFGSTKLQPGIIDLDALEPDLRVIPHRLVSIKTLVGAADVNGDGVKDLLLTERVNSSLLVVPILLGPFTQGEAIDLDSHSSDANITFSRQVDFFNPVFLADVNGDHIADILVKESIFDERLGVSFTAINILFGSQNLSSGVEISLSDGQASATVMAGLGASVIATGDANGDGFDDILLGHPTYSGEPAPPPWFSGAVSLVLGSSSMQGVINQPDVLIAGLPVPAEFQPIFQATLGDHLGESINMSDIDGDGISDILIGAPGVTSNKNGQVKYLSRAHVIVGSTEIKKGARIEIGQGQQDVTVSFDSKTSNIGREIGSGDFNGDGIQDILVGDTANVYIFFGGPIRPPHITKAKYSKSSERLTISGTDFTGAARIEINGVITDAEVTFDADSDELVLRGEKAELNLHDGKNQVAVIRKGARSNTAKLKF